MSFVWNDEIKQNIIKELNEQFDSISYAPRCENHSYADSIFSFGTNNMFQPMKIDSVDVPNYFETTISRTRTLKEIPIHTLAFSDSFDEKKKEPVGFSYSTVATYDIPVTVECVSEKQNYCDMEQIVNSSSAITFSLTPEQRNVAIAKKATWKEVLFEDARLINNTQLADAIRRFCSIQIKI